MHVLFGSQTGNSEDIAESIIRRLKILGFHPLLTNLEDYEACRLVQEELVIFVCSTTGDGEFPDSMKSFWKFLLRKNLSCDSLYCMKFCVVGLGDSSYEKYNVVAKKLNKRLKQLRAQEFMPLTLFNDQHELGYDADFGTFLQTFSQKIIEMFHCNPLESIDDNILLPPKYRVSFSVKTPDNNHIFQSDFPTCYASVFSNERVTSVEHFQAVHLIKFNIDERIHYNPGDVVVLMPENEAENVEDFVKLFNFPPDSEFVLQPTDSHTPLPKNLPVPCTLRNCATSFWDIQSIPRRSFFDLLWHFSKSDIEREKLQEFTTGEGQEELYSYCNRPRRTILEVLQDFRHTTPYIPLDYFFDLIPSIRPRSFSIASAFRFCPNELHVLVAVVEYNTRLKKPRKGLCSTWLSQLECNAEVKIPFTLKPGSILLPTTNVPLIMIGPGTGCAPFRAFIQHRVSSRIKRNFLFFGCRYKDKDFLCEEEWQSYVKDEMLTVFVAFSRDQDYKIYVQDKMREQSGLLWELLHNCGAITFIAGNAKDMPSDVKSALTDIIMREGNMSLSASQEYIKNLQSQRRLQIETWS